METPNLKYIKELSGGDIAFEESLLSILKKEFPEELALFHYNYLNKNYDEASNNVHKIKHKISILGLEKGLALATKFEVNLKNGDILLYDDFVNILNKILVYLGCENER